MLQSVDTSLKGTNDGRLLIEGHILCGELAYIRCIRGLLSDKIVILVTHQIHYLDQCDTMLGLKEVNIFIHITFSIYFYWYRVV